MANRMEIELTSARDDETFTWRAAGARQPRGVVAASLLPSRSKIGDVLRAEVEVEIEGITVVAILPAKEKASETGKIELIAATRETPLVTTVLASRSDRHGGRPDRDGERKPRRTSDRDGRHQVAEQGSRREEGGRRPTTSPSRRPESRRPDNGEPTRPPPEGTRAAPRRQPSDRSRGGPSIGRSESARGRPTARRGPVRFEPGTAHRDELLASLTAEQRPIAERLAVGGLPAIRKALNDEQQRARAEGRPAASGETIIAIAEQLQPDVKAAMWLDRAEAAIGRVDELTLRDLRATVVGAAARDEAGRTLERELREALDRRVAKLRQDWEQHLDQALEGGRVLQGLRLSAKPPEPTARFPGTLAVRLAELAGQAMTEETSAERWLSLLEAAVDSPVRRQVKPAGMPKDPSGEVERHARMAAGRIPALARLLGMPIPPPPKPVTGERLSRRRPSDRSSTTAARPRTAPEGDGLLEPSDGASSERTPVTPPEEPGMLPASPASVPASPASALESPASVPESPASAPAGTSHSEELAAGEEAGEPGDES